MKHIDFATGIILTAGFISIFVIGLTSVGVWLYHRDGGSKSTGQILKGALIKFVAPLTTAWEWIHR